MGTAPCFSTCSSGRTLLKGALSTALGTQIEPVQVFCCPFSDKKEPQIPLSAAAAGFDNFQQHHTLSSDTAKGGTCKS